MDNSFIKLSQEKPLIKSKAKWYKRWWFILLALFFIYLLIGNLINYFSGGFIRLDKVERVSPEKLFANSEDDPAWGAKNLPVQIVEFADFECPFSAESFPVIRETLFRYQDQISFVYRDFPDTEGHPNALRAAMAGQCALEQDKFWPLHDKFFINQDELDEASISRYALEIGLDMAKFSECLSTEKYKDEVLRDYQDGQDLEVIGTPTFFVNGYLVQGWQPLETFLKLVDLALKE